MSVSSELLCSFELLKPLDSSELKQQMKKGRSRRSSMNHQSPVCCIPPNEVDDGKLTLCLQPAIMNAQSY